MKKLLALFALAFVSCSPQCIDADAIHESIFLVTVRHDAYVKADLTLDEQNREAFLRTSELLRNVVQEARE